MSFQLLCAPPTAALLLEEGEREDAVVGWEARSASLYRLFRELTGFAPMGSHIRQGCFTEKSRGRGLWQGAERMGAGERVMASVFSIHQRAVFDGGCESLKCRVASGLWPDEFGFPWGGEGKRVAKSPVWPCVQWET